MPERAAASPSRSGAHSRTIAGAERCTRAETARGASSVCQCALWRDARAGRAYRTRAAANRRGRARWRKTKARGRRFESRRAAWIYEAVRPLGLVETIAQPRRWPQEQLREEGAEEPLPRRVLPEAVAAAGVQPLAAGSRPLRLEQHVAGLVGRIWWASALGQGERRSQPRCSWQRAARAGPAEQDARPALRRGAHVEEREVELVRSQGLVELERRRRAVVRAAARRCDLESVGHLNEVVARLPEAAVQQDRTMAAGGVTGNVREVRAARPRQRRLAAGEPPPRRKRRRVPLQRPAGAELMREELAQQRARPRRAVGARARAHRRSGRPAAAPVARRAAAPEGAAAVRPRRRGVTAGRRRPSRAAFAGVAVRAPRRVCAPRLAAQGRARADGGEDER